MSFIREANAEPIPGYRLIEPIGSGGFGEAWKCEAPGGLFKAIKFVYGNLNSLDVEGARAEQELHALNRVKEVRHPFVLSLDRIEVVEGELVIVMELADKSLHDVYVECQNSGLIGVPRDDLLRYLRDAAEALDHMNEKHNLQHLDIKPRNLFIISDRVKVADFGLVKHLERQSASGMLGGVTPLYASPETFAGKISGTSDQYSLAVVYQELLTGQRPFSGKNARQLAQQHLQEEPELRGLPEAERPVVARALSKEPTRRFPNCLAFLRALYTVPTMHPEPMSREAVRAHVPGQRPKSMAETLENVLLEQGSADEEVDLAAAPAADAGMVEEVSQLGLTIAQPQTGALRPTLIVGVGSLGRRAILDLRCRFVDRFGDLNKIPLLRFLYVDSDLDSLKGALRGAAEVALRSGEIYHLPLRSIMHYRRKQLDHLNDWIPREKLFAMPRSLKTNGSRALGRLAFTDNYNRFLSRLKHEVQLAMHPDALYQSVNQTGLALRDNTPRVYVLGAAGGGGSGCLVDLGYTLRRLMQQLRQPTAPVTALLLCGAPEDPATPPAEQSNVYATLTELNHYADPAMRFAAQYGADGPQTVDKGPPFDTAYLLTQKDRTPEARRDVLAHLCSYLFHDLTTPMGLRLDHGRRLPASGLTPFRSFGTYGVWFPRGLLLRMGARNACKKIIEEWLTAGEPEDPTEVEAACARLFADPDLRAEALTGQVEETAAIAVEGRPSDALRRMLAAFEEQFADGTALDDAPTWARGVMTRVREWLGPGLGSNRETGEWRKSRLSRSIEAASQKTAEEWDRRLAATAMALTEHPGRRLAAAEAALHRIAQFCEDQHQAHARNVEPQSQQVDRAHELLQNALEACLAGTSSFSLFGGKAKRQLRVFLDHLAAYARQCLAQDVAVAVRQFYMALCSRLGDRIKDLSFCRQRLRHLQDVLDMPMMAADNLTDTPYPVDLSPTPSSLPSPESFWEAIRESATTRVVLPNGDADLEQAAHRFLASLKPEHWVQLDQNLQDTVLAPLGGLHRACMGPADAVRHLLAPLVDRTALCLGSHLPITDVAEADATGGNLADYTLAYFESAAPLVSGEETGNVNDYLLTPASDAGKAYGEAARKLRPGVQVLRVPGQADLMFCREQGYLAVEDVERVFKACRKAYDEAAVVPQVSPHARFDVTDWVPLTP